jgi:hypothetical protein
MRAWTLVGLGILAVAALLALPSVTAHAGNGGAAFDAQGVAEGEDYVGFDAACEGVDGEHTSPQPWPGTSGDAVVLIPNTNCSVTFDDLVFPASGAIASARVTISGAGGMQGGTVSLFYDGSGSGGAAAAFTMNVGVEPWVDIAFPLAPQPAGPHDLRLRWEASGAGYLNLWVDCLLLDSSGGSCIDPEPAPPQVEFTWTLEEDCLGSHASFVATGGTQDDTFLWAFGDGAFAAGRHVAHSYLEPGRYEVELRASGNGGTTTLHATLESAGDPNCPVTLDPLPDLILWVGQEAPVCPVAHDPDPQDTPTWTHGPLPPGAAFAEPGPCFRWAPRAGAVGDWGPILVTVSDGPTAASRSFTIQVRMAHSETQDRDQDGVGDLADNCPAVPNQDQADADGDGMGDLCDEAQDLGGAEPGAPGPQEGPRDLDHDGVADARDLCPTTPDPDQGDTDRDGQGDACDQDRDGDGMLDSEASAPRPCPAAGAAACGSRLAPPPGEPPVPGVASLPSAPGIPAAGVAVAAGAALACGLAAWLAWRRAGGPGAPR